MNKLLVGAVAAAVLATPALAQVDAGSGAGLTRAELETRVRSGFERVDANRDGFVTRDEAKAVRASKRGERRADRREKRETAFARLDVNRDGSISRTEFLERSANLDREDRRERRAERKAERRERLAERRAMRGGAAMRLGGERFARIDADKDGRVSLAEALAARVRAFERADVDRDGRVTREERRAVREARAAA